ncbi:MAG: 50S ribosomal protein L13 [Candidatus Kapaibacterium sp.]|nr:50S ribosomal protein L13 [Ignavibacteriota bacterium]MCB9220231.1 50S ribosomal protein L13 [Ignavibacteria bacterium]
MSTGQFTKSLRKEDVNTEWWLVDASGQTVGRVATKIATLIRGKHKPSFTPHVDDGDCVVVINAEKVVFTGKREDKKTYFKHTGYHGSETFTPVKEVREKHPERILERAVKGMLPKTKLGRKMSKKLKVYAGSEHPHEAQMPKKLEI